MESGIELAYFKPASTSMKELAHNPSVIKSFTVFNPLYLH